ncbi:PA0069 family radical SAM protein [Roseateles violae]|uniref:PA0069 family radical SAM protein n=1 Tax=Roseateles violae TaxID=3058042 RepID=A0ABT8DZS6_9BURK|nr:PA0069 family radical SAM protein [Pelomonas sp. PFR6]MDN3923067.1 PA0069 family radical SAM protein [Pelomonas sp. PFR6]
MPFKPSTNATPAQAQPLYVQADSLKGRGSGWAIAHRYQNELREQYDDGWGSLVQEAGEEHLPPSTQIIEERAKSIISSNQSPDISFDTSINPYRGCEHGCIYCFARPTHSYLNLSPGIDFETKIIAKVNAAERLRASFASPSYQPRSLCIGTATDAYQPVERKLGITRALIEVLAEHGHPFSMVTKSSGIERDLDLIAPMAARNLASVYLSVTTLDPALARILEPRAAAPHRRLRTIETLAQAGVPVGVSVSPLIPFLNEPELERILEAAAAAGARAAFSIPLRLPWEVNPLFQDWLQRHYPDRAARVMARLREMRGGRDNDPRFGSRMSGEGLWAQLIAQRLKKASQRFGLTRERVVLDLSQFRRPTAMPAGGGRQGELF